MSVITIRDRDLQSIRVTSEPSIEMELAAHFAFDAPGARYDKRVRMGLWDGKIRLWNSRTKLLPYGLKEKIFEFADESGYEVDDLSTNIHEVVDDTQIDAFIESLNLPSFIDRRDYQTEMLKIAAEDKRGILLCPTSGGKSLSIYQILKWFDQKTLIVVPTTTLVDQLAGDFADYGYAEPVAKIRAGASKEQLPQVTITTWQSAFKMPPAWFAQFKTLIGDEAHTFNANSLKKIMEKSVATVRIGLTGSLDGAKVNELALQGMFGKITRVATTRELIDAGYAADVTISAIQLCYPEAVRKDVRKSMRALTANGEKEKQYPEEIKFITTYDRRNLFIRQLASKLDGNVLILFRKIDHGKDLYALFKDRFQNCSLIYGETKTEIRDDIRKYTETTTDSRIIASFKTFATGINIRNLHHIIIASPLKSQILLIQAIGRALRIGDEKTEADVWDLGDDLSIGVYQNHAYRHFISRLELYTKEQFKVKHRRIQL